ncbi:MAG: response regulator [Chloroflexi bacterium]|nr:MAG: response regulator [Chloroflexota bacterium]
MERETLLIVEDNMILRDGLKEMLRFEGFHVLTAGNGEEALHQMATITPDLILSDISMPVMDGYTFFYRVRERAEWVRIPFVFLTARGEREDIMIGRDLGAEDYLVKPLSREELLTAVRARLARSQQLQMAQLEHAYEGSLTVLANAIEVRNEYTRGHVERVTAYAMILAEQIGFAGRRLEALRFGAILHDIGKIHVRESILTKKEPLTPEEWDEIKLHPITGAEMIKGISYLAPAIPIVRWHHECWDGSGYPDNLVGEAIPLEARIVTVADCFDAMTTERSYRPSLSLEEAYAEIISCAGCQFDPAVVSAFQNAWEKGEIQKIGA